MTPPRPSPGRPHAVRHRFLLTSLAIIAVALLSAACIGGDASTAAPSSRCEPGAARAVAIPERLDGAERGTDGGGHARPDAE